MKIQLVERIEVQEKVQYELVVKDGLKYVVTEGSVLECNEGVRSQIRELFDAPSDIDISEIGLIALDDEDRFKRFLHTAKYNSELDVLDNKTFSSVLNEEVGKPGVRQVLKESLAEITKKRVGLIINNINEEYESVVLKKEQLEAMGYDCMACFVNLPLQEIIARKNGTGVIDDPALSRLWKEAQANIARYSELFGGNLAVVNGADSEKFMRGIEFVVEHFVTEPVENPIGQNIMIRSRTVHNYE